MDVPNCSFIHHIRHELYIFFFIASGVGLSPLYCGHFWPIVPAPDDRWGWLWSCWWNEDWQGKPKYSEETCPSATLSTTDPTWPDPWLNPGRHDGKPATNCLSYGAANLISWQELLAAAYTYKCCYGCLLKMKQEVLWYKHDYINICERWPTSWNVSTIEIYCNMLW
jgi:hypothetical protein